MGSGGENIWVLLVDRLRLQTRPKYASRPQRWIFGLPARRWESRPLFAMNKAKVLVADPVSERGIAEVAEGGLLDVTVKTGLKEAELLEIIGEFSGLVVLSQS